MRTFITKPAGYLLQFYYNSTSENADWRENLEKFLATQILKEPQRFTLSFSIFLIPPFHFHGLPLLTKSCLSDEFHARRMTNSDTSFVHSALLCQLLPGFKLFRIFLSSLSFHAKPKSRSFRAAFWQGAKRDAACKSSVDLRGFEPLASSVRLRRAPNCATGPSNERKTF